MLAPQQISVASDALELPQPGQRRPMLGRQCATTLIRDLEGIDEWWQSAQSCSIPRAPGYVILTSSYVPNSAGIACLYRLCDALNRLGYASYMTGGRVTAPHLAAPLVHRDVAKALCARGFTAIYPETIRGNPLAAGTVVRWVLNRPGFLGGDKVYDDSEHVYCYTDVYRSYVENRVAGNLYLPTIDETLFYCEDADLSKRSLECFYIGKSRWQDGVVERDGLLEITRQFPRRAELGKLFRAARVLYCFDNSTIMAYEALLCGCPVVIVPDGTQTRADYERSELGMDGLSWGRDEKQPGPVDVVALKKKYGDIKRQFQHQLLEMVRATAPCPSKTDVSLPSTPRWNGSQTMARRPLRAIKRLVWQMIDQGRATEQTLRLWRKQWQTDLGNREHAKMPLDSAEELSFLCNGSLQTARRLECFHIGRSKWQNGVVDPTQAFEITADMPARQLAILLRSAKTFYTFDKRSRLIQLALRCGADVIVVGKDGQCERIFPRAAVENVASLC